MSTNTFGQPISQAGGSIVPSVPGQMPQYTPPSSLTSANLAPQTPITPVQPTPPPVYNTQTLAPTTPQLTETPEESQQSDLSKQLESLTNEDAGKAAFTTQQQNAAGIPGLQQAQTDLSTQLNTLKTQSQQIPLIDQNAGVGRMSVAGISGQDTVNLRNNAVQSLAVSAQIDATNGLLSSAQQKVTDAVNQQYGPIEANIAAIQANLKNIQNDPQSTVDEKNAASAQSDAVAQQAAQIAAQKQNSTDIYNLAVSSAANIASFKPTAQYPTAATALSAIQNAPDKATALSIAASTGLSSSQSPLDIAYKQAQLSNMQANTAKTYADIAATAATSVNDPNAAPTDPTSQSILSQTGLSIAAFNYLTQGTAALSRLSATDRKNIMNEAQTYLNKTGTDYSTFQSQYKAYNDVLQKNIERANNTQIFAGEVAGSADALLSAISPSDLSGLSNNGFFGIGTHQLSAQNVADLAAGKAVNNPIAMKYQFQIQAMANDLAGYFAASRGGTSPDDADLASAGKIIANGLNSGSVQAFKDSIDANEKKVTGVVNTAVNSTQQQVWNLFGVGSKFSPSSSTSSSSNPTGTIVTAPDGTQVQITD